MRAGNLDLALITGAEALATVRRLKKAGEQPAVVVQAGEKRPFPWTWTSTPPRSATPSSRRTYLRTLRQRPPGTRRMGARRPPRRTGPGHGADDRGRRGEPARVVPRRPHAPTEIVTPTADNRMVAYPYTKLMTAIMDVDMAASLVLAEPEKADALGVPRTGGSTSAAGATPRTRRTSPATPTCGAPRHGRRRRRRAGGRRHRRPTTSRTSTSTPASPAPSAPRSTPSGSARTTPAPARYPDRRPAVPRRPGLELHDALDGGHGRDPAPRTPAPTASSAASACTCRSTPTASGPPRPGRPHPTPAPLPGRGQPVGIVDLARGRRHRRHLLGAARARRHAGAAAARLRPPRRRSLLRPLDGGPGAALGRGRGADRAARVTLRPQDQLNLASLG